MFNLFFSIIIFILGLIIGSFLNCVIYRLENDKSFIKGRSFCPSCKHNLSSLDLIPVLSYLFLGGKCRYCKKKISIHYPIIEIATGLLFLLVFLNSTGFLEIAVSLAIFSLLIVIFIFDLKHSLIPDLAIYPAIILSLIWRIYIGLDITIIYSLLVSAGFFFLIVFLSKERWMGMGDVKLALFMGLFLGWPNIIVGLFSAFVIGSIVGLVLILNKKRSMRSEVPFGPFLITGTLIAFFWGQKIINWYLDLFLIQ